MHKKESYICLEVTSEIRTEPQFHELNCGSVLISLINSCSSAPSFLKTTVVTIDRGPLVQWRFALFIGGLQPISRDTDNNDVIQLLVGEQNKLMRDLLVSPSTWRR